MTFDILTLTNDFDQGILTNNIGNIQTEEFICNVCVFVCFMCLFLFYTPIILAYLIYTVESRRTRKTRPPRVRWS